MGRINKNLMYGMLAAAVLWQSEKALAGQVTQPSCIENLFSPLSVSIELSEPDYTENQHALPGGSIRKDPQITNTGNCDLYVFLEVEIPIKTIRTVEEGSILPARKTELCAFTPSESWVFLDKIEEDGESQDHTAFSTCYVYGYDRVLAPGLSTEPLFTGLSVVNYLEGEMKDRESLQVNIKAMAIQADFQATTDIQELWTLYQTNKE